MRAAIPPHSQSSARRPRRPASLQHTARKRALLMQHADRRYAAADIRHGRVVDYDALARQDERAKVVVRVAEFEDRLLEAEEQLLQLLGDLDVVEALRHLLRDPARLEVASTLLAGARPTADVAAPTPPRTERSSDVGPLKARAVTASPMLSKQQQQQQQQQQSASTTMEDLTTEDDSRLSASGTISPMPVKVDELVQPIQEDIIEIRMALETLKHKVDDNAEQERKQPIQEDIIEIRMALETLKHKVDDNAEQDRKQIEELRCVANSITYDHKVQCLEDRLGEDMSATDKKVRKLTDSMEALKLESASVSKQAKVQLDELSSCILSLTSDHEVLEARLGARVAALERDLERQLRALQGHIAVSPQPSPKASRQASREASPQPPESRQVHAKLLPPSPAPPPSTTVVTTQATISPASVVSGLVGTALGKITMNVQPGSDLSK